MKADISTSRASTQGMVAARAGVSQVTVSQILGGRAENYHADTQEKVRRAAEELGYRPNRYARVMRNGKTGLIALIDFGGMRQLAQRKIRAAAEAVTRENYEPLVQENFLNLPSGGDGGVAICQRVLDARVEGVILVHPKNFSFNQGNLTRLLNAGIPVVAISGGHLKGIPRFFSEREWGYHALAKHLLELGYRHLGTLADDTRYLPAGVERAVAEHPGDAQTRHCRPRDMEDHFNPALGYLRGKAGMEEILTWKTRPDAVLCGNDEWAQGALAACAEAGLRVPHDIALTGFDDDVSSAFGAVPLTTVAQPIEEMARGAVQSLLKMIREGRPPQEGDFRFPGTMIIRRSCGSLLKEKEDTE